ncbi:hypothetical protein F4604DRAFT_1675165 [Suillus subluteus]|nr:hypothetical protein F4604DRAFT_1675165 [Suillus subluteus]
MAELTPTPTTGGSESPGPIHKTAYTIFYENSAFPVTTGVGGIAGANLVNWTDQEVGAISKITLSPPLSSRIRYSPIATSDASMLPSPASFLQARSIISAAATPDSWVAFSLASHGTSIYPVFTGHKNAVRFVLDVLPGVLPHVWNGQPVHSLYRWQFHTRMSSLDHMASSVQHSGGVLASLRLQHLLWPDDYTIFTPSCGFIECNLSSFVVSRLEDAYASNDSFHPAQAMTLALYDRYLLPDFPYTRASSSFSAAVQLYARSSQLDTAQPSWLSAVRIACNSEETSLLEGKTIDHIREVFDWAARRLFSDDCGVVATILNALLSGVESQVGVLPPLSNVSGDTASLDDVDASSPQACYVDPPHLVYKGMQSEYMLIDLGDFRHELSTVIINKDLQLSRVGFSE